MRRFELLVAFVAVVAVAWPAIFGVRPRRGIISLFLLGSLVAHFQFEGFRWQMIPLYVVSLSLAGGDVLFIDRQIGWSNRLARGIFGVGGVLLASALPLALPVPELPSPPGPEAIGTVTIQLTDPDRVESYGPRPGRPRRIMTQVWYPADSDQSIQPQQWAQDWDVVAPALAERAGLPSWFLNHTKYADSNARESLAPLDGNFPVIIYSHGWTGFRSIAINQIEALVSNGYIVIAPDHTYGAVATKLEGGEVIPYDPQALPDKEAVTDTEYTEATELVVSTFAADVVTILNELEKGPDGSFAYITDNADTSSIGLYGHSTGGGAVVKVCLEDERCDAVLGMDAWVEPIPDEVLKISATKPAMFMRSDDWRGTENDAVLRGIAARSETVSYWIGIDGAGHYDFTIVPLLSPLAAQFGLKGPIAAGRMLPIVDNYLVGFFDVFLLGTGSAALDAVTFDEVTVELVTGG